MVQVFMPAELAVWAVTHGKFYARGKFIGTKFSAAYQSLVLRAAPEGGPGIKHLKITLTFGSLIIGIFAKEQAYVDYSESFFHVLLINALVTSYLPSLLPLSVLKPVIKMSVKVVGESQKSQFSHLILTTNIFSFLPNFLEYKNTSYASNRQISVLTSLENMSCSYMATCY